MTNKTNGAEDAPESVDVTRERLNDFAEIVCALLDCNGCVIFVEFDGLVELGCADNEKHWPPADVDAAQTNLVNALCMFAQGILHYKKIEVLMRGPDGAEFSWWTEHGPEDMVDDESG